MSTEYQNKLQLHSAMSKLPSELMFMNKTEASPAVVEILISSLLPSCHGNNNLSCNIK
jgi:hypothetical protein